MNEDAFAERDAYGLTEDDWASFLSLDHEHYTGPALLWWALAGAIKAGVSIVPPNALPDLLTVIAGDAHALTALASASDMEEVEALGLALHNLHRRLLAAAEIAQRAAELEADNRRPPPQGPSAQAIPPSSKILARR